MAIDLKMPLLGDIMQEGTLVEWLRGQGERVAPGEPIYRVEADKVSLDVAAPAAGVLQQLARAGEVVPVGGLVGRLVTEAEAPTETSPAPPEPVEGRAGNGAALALSSEIRATPAARRLARELGVALGDVAVAQGGGRIYEEHVRAFSVAHAATPAPVAPTPAHPEPVEGLPVPVSPRPPVPVSPPR
ncbi:MAG: E3 binding domain-containing protein, partial [Chloroflexi bacterium]|nr:E3 binding domain-containing protein [Chloroflexota bacterium]